MAIAIPANSDATVTLKLKGQVFAEQGLELAGEINALIAYWNTTLERNVPPNEPLKITAVAGPVRAGTGMEPPRGMNDL